MNEKEKRQKEILRLIEDRDINTQKELTTELNKGGYHVTQATVSRDIRQLGLTKLQNGARSVYTALERNNHSNEDKYIQILKSSFLSMEAAENILVVKTAAGTAMAAAAALDALRLKELVGCIAGDDTIMCAIRTSQEAKKLIKKLEEIVK